MTGKRKVIAGTPVSVEFISSIIADIHSLEPVDLEQFTAAFDNFDPEDLEKWFTNVKRINHLLTLYNQAITGKYRERYKLNNQRRAEKKRLAKAKKDVLETTEGG